jgi:hypothetical protein
MKSQLEKDLEIKESFIDLLNIEIIKALYKVLLKMLI